MKPMKHLLGHLFLVSSITLLISLFRFSYAAEENIVLEQSMQGAEAVVALGGQLEAVAANHGMTEEALQTMLSEDATLWVDKTGGLMSIEPIAEDLGTIQGDSFSNINPTGPTISAARVEGETETGALGLSDDGRLVTRLGNVNIPIADSDVFNLNSKPNSKRTIYLDFDGATVTGTAHNVNAGLSQINIATFESNGTSVRENSSQDFMRYLIVDVWSRVAEDFAPFDVNVTTANPGSAAINRESINDSEYGLHVIFSENDFLNCNCSGLVHVGGFDSVGSDYHTIFNYVLSPDFTSSLIGRSLGLSRDSDTGGDPFSEALVRFPWLPIYGRTCII